MVLAKVYLQKGRLLNDPEALEKIEVLLGHDETLQSDNAKAQGYLLRAEATSDPLQQEQLYKELLRDRFAETTAYKKGWYYWALQRFEREKSW